MMSWAPRCSNRNNEGTITPLPAACPASRPRFLPWGFQARPRSCGRRPDSRLAARPDRSARGSRLGHRRTTCRPPATTLCGRMLPCLPTSPCCAGSTSAAITRCRWQSCALFSFRRTEAEAPTKAMNSHGVIRSFRTDLNSSTLRRRGEGETANRVKIRPSIGFQHLIFRERPVFGKAGVRRKRRSAKCRP